VKVDGGGAVAPDLMAALTGSRRCGSERDGCRLAVAGPEQAVLLSASCETCPPMAALFQRLPDGRWRQLGGGDAAEPAEVSDPQVLARGRIELREVTKRQVFLDGKPVGTIFD
jgi:hypothetical protein